MASLARSALAPWAPLAVVNSQTCVMNVRRSFDQPIGAHEQR
jgi:hypothetical protein